MTGAPTVYALDVTIVGIAAAQGSVAVSPPPMAVPTSCGFNCTTYLFGAITDVVVTATGGPLFQSLTGACTKVGNKTSTTGQCHVVMTGHQAVTATFRPAINYVFVTSLAYYPGVDIKPSATLEQAVSYTATPACSARAAAAGLSGSYIAWLGDEGYAVPPATAAPPSSPKNYLINSTVGWIRTDGVAVAANRPGLLGGSVSNPINHDEYGNDLSTDSLRSVMTGADSNGTFHPNGTCQGWHLSTADATNDSTFGSIDYSTSNWTNVGHRPCNLPARLYCFENDF